MPAMHQSSEIKINKIFLSRQGEGLHMGKLTVFVRLSGCNLNCSWCDTSYHKVGRNISVKEIIEEVEKHGPCLDVCITGGEPLIQKPAVIKLSKELVKRNYFVVLETNGTIDWEGMPEEALISMDVKPPSSHMDKFNDYSLLEKLRPQDQLKVVIGAKRDYDFLTSLLDLHKPEEHTQVILQPAGGIFAKNLWRWAETEPRVRVMLQIHKVIWGNARGR